MITQILEKISRKHSKSSHHPSSLNSSKRKSSIALDEAKAISPPCSVLNIRNTQENKPLLSTYPISIVNPIPTKYEQLPGFSDVPSSLKQLLLAKKLKMCCVVFDFSNPTKHAVEKEVKKRTLLELVEHIASPKVKLPEYVIQESINMVSVNIFRDFTPQPREKPSSPSLEMEEDEPLVYPAWPHLQLVYEFLLRFITSLPEEKIAKRYIDRSFLLKLLKLFDSDSTSERESLKTVLHLIYGKFTVHRTFIRESINNIFHCFTSESSERHNGIAEFLEVTGSIIDGFALPLKEEHKLFLVKTLIPLHKPKCLSMYHQQLLYCITRFVEKDYKLADVVIRGLLKYWPVSNSAKEVLFLDEVEEVLELTQAPEFHRCAVPLFRRVFLCMSSLHFQVAERALFLWSNNHFVSLIELNREVILPMIFPALERNARDHWNLGVRGLTFNVRKIFYEGDPELFVACMVKFRGEEDREKEAAERREATWKLLEDAAAKNGDPCNEAVLVS